MTSCLTNLSESLLCLDVNCRNLTIFHYFRSMQPEFAILTHVIWLSQHINYSHFDSFLNENAELHNKKNFFHIQHLSLVSFSASHWIWLLELTKKVVKDREKNVKLHIKYKPSCMVNKYSARLLKVTFGVKSCVEVLYQKMDSDRQHVAISFLCYYLFT